MNITIEEMGPFSSPNFIHSGSMFLPRMSFFLLLQAKKDK